MKALKDEDQRKEWRNEASGDILWIPASGTHGNNVSEGIILDESESGLGILTSKPIEEGCIIKICFKNRWMSVQYAKGKWCSEIASATYRCGLKIGEQI